ncbi:sugar/nucleoside kinase (ribokinase family) [Caldicoprobacter guelmensis]|uniref:carbohydrate kinase family protein n=1 Tax=Caldicoprobacter guelmensis TaxID=1170224 RepID=UPI00195ED041|nr:carbohydrate kinase family protein [Caldicoprobacter guelmensis]MBM7581680.1 sugar/nucleoside kinase (ribokinase family) [Caldicoprobacter guelmensis]
MSSGGIAVGGNLVVDYLKVVDSYPKEGHLATIYSITKSVGGAVTNVLIDLAKMDPSLKLQAIGLVGCDEDGEFVLDLLNRHNIDTRLVRKETSVKTSFTDVITVESTGHRTFFHYRGANSFLAPAHFDFSQIDAELLHVGYILLLDTLDSFDDEYGTLLARVLADAQRKGIKTSIDVVSENSDRFSRIVPPSLKYTNYCIINEVEASLTTHIPARDSGGTLILENVEKMCAVLFEMGVQEWVVVHAPEGAVAMDKSRKVYRQPSLALPPGYIKGTVGAGDAFCAGVLYSIYKGWDIEKALAMGTAAAACCLSEVSATEGMKDIESIEKLFNSTPKGNF